MRGAPARGLRIAQLIETDAPRGAEGVVYQLATGLRSRGHIVLPVVLPNGEGWLSGRLRDEGYPVHMPRLARPVDAAFARALAAWSRRERVDVLHAHEFTFGFYAGVAGLLARTPHMITMHGGVTFANAARRRWALGWSARRAAASIGVSEATAAHLANAVGLARSRVQLVLNGVPTPVPTRGRVETRQALNVSEDHFVALSVGSLHPVKGHATLVDACAHLQRMEGLPPWTVCIAGRGSEELSLSARIRELGLEQRVILLGLRSDIPDLLAAADGWVMPSLSEGLPLALLEAMLAKLPIVSTAVGGIPDLIVPGKTGLLVPPADPAMMADALATLMRQREAGSAMAAQAFALANAEFTADTMVERYIALYEGAVGTRRR